MMKVCASDLDGALADCEEELGRRVRDHFGLVPWHPVESTAFYVHEKFGLEEEKVREFLFSDDAFDDPNLWLAAKPYEDRIAEMNKWALNGNIPSIITARPPKLRLITELWMSRNNVPYSNLLMGAGRGKGKLAWHIDAAFMVEDNVNEAQEVASHGVRCYLIQMPYNLHVEESEFVIPVESYGEITERERL